MSKQNYAQIIIFFNAIFTQNCYLNTIDNQIHAMQVAFQETIDRFLPEQLRKVSPKKHGVIVFICIVCDLG